MREFIIKKNDTGQRLDRFIAKAVPLLPSSLTQKYIRLKRIKVNSKGAKKDTRLNEGDIIQLYINDEFFQKPSEENAYLTLSSHDIDIDIIYEDENILLVNKPAGVLCHPDGSWSYNTLIARIQAYLYQKQEWNPKGENSFAPALCNRIDRNTSGIVISAKNAEALKIINEKIKLREIDKYYLCIACGKLKPPAGILSGYIFKDSAKNQVYVKSSHEKGYKTAATEYKTLAFKNGLSLVECRLLTGRTHQIRAHMASAGAPLLGDGKYGTEKFNKIYHEKKQALCSYKLIFSFKTDAGLLNYLNGRNFAVERCEFVEKYFHGFSVN